MSNDIEIAVEVTARTDNALMLTDGNVTEWIPRSQISDYTGSKDSPESVFIPEWLALKKGFI